RTLVLPFFCAHLDFKKQRNRLQGSGVGGRTSAAALARQAKGLSLLRPLPIIRRKGFVENAEVEPCHERLFSEAQGWRTDISNIRASAAPGTVRYRGLSFHPPQGIPVESVDHAHRPCDHLGKPGCLSDGSRRCGRPAASRKPAPAQLSAA